MSEQTQKPRPGGGGNKGQDQEFVKVDPGTDEANETLEKLKKAQAVKPKPRRRACCCCC